MFRDILSSRAILIGLVFFVLMVAGSLLYSWHVRRTTEAELESTNHAVQALKNKNDARPAQEVNVLRGNETPGFVDTLNKHTDTPMSDEIEVGYNETENLDIVDAFLPDDMSSEEASAEQMLVSPYGFGPYPPLPDDPYWVPETWPAKSANHELMLRVSIKLISQGIPVKGGSMQNGLVYPSIKGIRYVEWKEYIGGNGIPVRYISRDTGHPDDREKMRTFKEATKGRNPTESDFPSGIEFVSYEEGGIDPYTFLDLP
ncbi:hypothetical protein F4054_07935 [Candidatus Poribacteria bacterium]|nr:hypothetical protein [Candidatus Poribacteria bacterium]MYG06584.1 hypothetical protein [Candidatus Poribacteria bacterium]MYK22175.1 hypothetical protein [Candidatus Poribacteria bacterium]